MSIASDPPGSTMGSLVDDAAEIWEAATVAFADQVRPALEDLAETAASGLESARDRIAEVARQRPVASIVAALGAGVLIGCLIAGRRR